MDSSTADVSDADLLDAWARGDQVAGERFARRHVATLLRFFRGRVGPLADDLAQETFIRLLERRRAGPRIEQVRAYLYAAARNLLYDRLRGHGDPQFDPYLSTMPGFTAGPSTALRRVTDIEQIRSALARLPVEFQLLLELRYWERLSSSELAVVLGVPAGTVRGRLRRARALLRAALESSEKDHED